MSPTILYYPHNDKGRTFVAGDLHGCYHQLETLLDRVKFDKENDILYLPGDLGDRGPESEKCFGLLDEDWVRVTAGNHEEIFIDSCDPRIAFNWENWRIHGGYWAEVMSCAKRMEYVKKLFELPVVIVVGEGERRFNVFHAEFHGSDAQLDKLIEVKDRRVPLSLQWGSELFKGNVSPSKHEGLSISFVGHRITSEVKQIGSHVYMDTGAFMAEGQKESEYGLSLAEIDVSGKPKIKEIHRFSY